MNHTEYWIECVESAAEECGAALTKEQATFIAEAVEGSHENFGMAFYSPPASDRISSIEREHQAKLADLKREFEAYQARAEKTVGRLLHQHSDAPLSIDKDGGVTRWGGRIERIA